MLSGSFTFYSDPGHGRLAVPIELVRPHLDRISVYSYARDGIAYLEEDCDITRWLKAIGVGDNPDACRAWFAANVQTFTHANDSADLPFRRGVDYIGGIRNA